MNSIRPPAAVGRSKLKTMAAAAALMALSGAAQAALVDRGGGMVYDSTRNITWLADMNYAHTSGYAAANTGGSFSTEIRSDGSMGWDAAKTWANNLVYGGYSDWRLPTLNPSDTNCSYNTNPGGGLPLQYYGMNCTGGEMSGLFITDLGNKEYESVLNQTGDTAEQIANMALFSNVQASGSSCCYWSGTAYAPIPVIAYAFAADQGWQYYDNGSNAFFAMAVRAGDVAASVPEPQTLALALLALGATVVARRRRSR